VDQSDAYLHWPVKAEHCDLLGIQHPVTKEFWRFRTLCFGLSVAPFVQQSISLAIKARLAVLGVTAIVYLDDFLLISESEREAAAHLQITLDLFAELGVGVKQSKVQRPTQGLEFLGIFLSVPESLATLTEARVAKLRRKVLTFLATHNGTHEVQRRALASITGSLNWFAPFYAEARALLHPLHTALYTLSPGVKTLSWHAQAKVAYTRACRRALHAWVRLLEQRPTRKVYLFNTGGGGFWSGTFAFPAEFLPEQHMFVPGFHGRDRIAVLTTDACTRGYGGFTGTERFQGEFKGDSLDLHINVKELLAVLYGLRKYAGTEWKGCRVLVRSDNMTTVAALNRRSHILPHLDAILAQVRSLCEEHKLDIAAQHIPGVQNELADALSRFLARPYTSDWRVHDSVFRKWDKAFGPHTVDGMAAADGSNAVLPKYWSREDDFMNQCLEGHNVWLNVDFTVAGPALQHICEQQIRFPASVAATVVVPYRPTKAWWRLYVRRAEVVGVYPPGTPLFSARRADATEADAPRALSSPCKDTIVVLRFHGAGRPNPHRKRR
jgi:hypothetical protein